MKKLDINDCSAAHLTLILLVHFNFPKVVQTHNLGEVGILGSALLRVNFGTILPICIEIWYLTDEEQNKASKQVACNTSWLSFFETQCIKRFKVFPRKVVRDSQKWMLRGSEFQRVGADTWKEREPNCSSHLRGTAECHLYTVRPAVIHSWTTSEFLDQI